jgi:hypothetical protein
MTFVVGYEIEGIIGHMIEFLDGGVQGAHSAEVPFVLWFFNKNNKMLLCMGCQPYIWLFVP